MIDSGRPPSVPVPAATVILLRERRPGADVEVFLVRRHRRSQFMSDAFVFPGGRIDEADGSAEVAAIRECFEEAGILLVRGSTPADLAERRRRLNAGEIDFREVLAAGALEPDVERLHAWARWVTPSAEPKRFDVRFFLAETPPGAEASFDDKETTEAVWLTPEEALTRHREEAMRLPPPQVKTLSELLPYAPAGIAAVVEAARRRAPHLDPILPRFADVAGTIMLLLPWDPEYERAGVGEAQPIPKGHFLAGGPSRFILEGMTWRLAYAPGSLHAG